MPAGLASVMQERAIPPEVVVDPPRWVCVGWARTVDASGYLYRKALREESTGRILIGALEHGLSKTAEIRDAVAQAWWAGPRDVDLQAKLHNWWGREVRP